jgi:hypothetical protein
MRFPVQFETFLDKYIRNAVSILGNGSRRDSAVGDRKLHQKSKAFQKSAAHNCQFLPAAA